jgi:hypothetical protein
VTTSTAPTEASGDRWLRRLALLLAAIASLEALGILALGSRGDPRFALGVNLVSIGFFGTIVSFPVVGAIIVARRPRTRVAWTMIGMGTLFGASLLAGAYSALYVSPSGGNVGPFAMELLLLSGLLFVPSLGFGTTTLLLLYPTDTLLSRRWRVVVASAALGTVIWNVGVLFRPGPIDNPSLTNVNNPLGAPADLLPLFDVLPAVANAFILGGFLLAAGSLIVRYRRGDSVVRAQIRWMALIAVVAFVSFVLSTVFEPNGDLFFGLGVTAIACLPIAIGVAISRYRLYDIDLIINRAIVYGSLTAILAGVFAAGVGLAQRLFVAFTGESSDAAIVLVTLVIATLYTPLRKRLETIIDRRFKYDMGRFGSYTDKVKSVLSVIDPARAAENLANEAVSELNATGAAVLDGSGSVIGRAGTWPLPDGADATTIALSVTGPIRSIVVGPRTGGREHRPVDLGALEEAGRLTAEAVRRT